MTTSRSFRLSIVARALAGLVLMPLTAVHAAEHAADHPPQDVPLDVRSVASHVVGDAMLRVIVYEASADRPCAAFDLIDLVSRKRIDAAVADGPSLVEGATGIGGIPAAQIECGEFDVDTAVVRFELDAMPARAPMIVLQCQLGVVDRRLSAVVCRPEEDQAP